MLTPSSEIIQLLTTFAPAFSQPTFAKVLLLIYGAILAPGKRTVTSMLRVLGKEQEANFGKWHRVLNQAPWSGFVLSRWLLELLVSTFVPEGNAPPGSEPRSSVPLAVTRPLPWRTPPRQ